MKIILPIVLTGEGGKSEFLPFVLSKYDKFSAFNMISNSEREKERMSEIALKVGSCPNDDNSVQILFCPFLCSI